MCFYVLAQMIFVPYFLRFWDWKFKNCAEVEITCIYCVSKLVVFRICSMSHSCYVLFIVLFIVGSNAFSVFLVFTVLNSIRFKMFYHICLFCI